MNKIKQSPFFQLFNRKLAVKAHASYIFTKRCSQFSLLPDFTSPGNQVLYSSIKTGFRNII